MKRAFWASTCLATVTLGLAAASGCGADVASNPAPAAVTPDNPQTAQPATNSRSPEKGPTQTGATKGGATDTGATDTGATDTGARNHGTTETGATAGQPTKSDAQGRSQAAEDDARRDTATAPDTAEGKVDRPQGSAASQPEVAIDTTPRPPASTDEAAAVLDLRTFPVIQEAVFHGPRLQVGELRYETSASVAEAFEFQCQALRERGWQMLPGARTDGENPRAEFTRDGFLVSTSVSNLGTQQPTSVFVKNHGNVPLEQLPRPEGAEPFYSMPTQAMYLTTADATATRELVERMLREQGWEFYGQAADTKYLKQNGILLSARVSTHPAQPGKTFIEYSTDVLSADLPIPPEVADPRYTDGLKQLTFDQPGEYLGGLVEFYQRALAERGWKATTNPMGDDEITLIYRNGRQDMLTLELQKFQDLTRVYLKHFTADEVEELDRQARLAAAERQQKAAQEAAEREVAAAARKVEIPIPGAAKKIEQEDEAELTFFVATGAGKGLAEAYRRHFEQAGWSVGQASVSDNFGLLSFDKGEMSFRISFTDVGLGRDVEFEVSGFDLRLIPNREVPTFTALGGLPPAPPLSAEDLARIPADLPIPADTRELIVRPGANVQLKVAAGVDRVAAWFQDAMQRHGWSHHSSDIDEDSGSLSFRKGRAPCGLSLQQHGGALTSVTIAGGGMNWERLRSAEQPLDPAVGPDATVPADLADLAATENRPGEATEAGETSGDNPWQEQDGQLVAARLPVPADARNTERDADTEMVIFRSNLAPSEVAAFYREGMTSRGWKEASDESFVDDELGVAALGFTKNEREVRVAVQDGSPESKTRVLIMGDGLCWDGTAEAAEAEWDENTLGEPDSEPAEESPSESVKLVGSGNCRGKIWLGDQEFSLQHALVRQRMEDDKTRLDLFLCVKPFARGADRKLTRADVSLFDLVIDEFPPSLSISISEGYYSITCFVDGASINLGTGKGITSTLKTAEQKLQGRLRMEEPEEFFEKPFRFDVQLEIPLAEPARPEPGKLAADETHELLLPEGTRDAFQRRSRFRSSVEASISQKLDAVREFYVAELPDRGWKPVPAAALPTAASPTVLKFEGDEGLLEVRLTQEGESTHIHIAHRNQPLAKSKGLLPADGKALIVLGNGTQAAVSITINGQVYRLAPGQGARDPAEALKLEITPGKYRLALQGGEAEEVEIAMGVTWGAFATPGGLFSDQLY